jgi:succinate dehydrogenase/fumarate reductase flavoprotein subunit
MSEEKQKWQREADVVVIGAGASGLPAAIVARESGASVILLEAEDHTGGHATTSSGGIALGGGTSVQKKYGIDDSPDLVFRDLTDWSIVEANGAPDYRYNDREIVRAFADNCAAAFEWLVEHGVVFVDQAPDKMGNVSAGNSALRVMHSAAMDWPRPHDGKPLDPAIQATTSSGHGLMMPLEVAARKAGVEILFEHKMTALHRESRTSGRVVGIAAEAHGTPLEIGARQAVIIATGGSTGNVNFRRMFDPRLTEEYFLAGMPWSNQDASGELAAMDVGAALWGLANQTMEFAHVLTKRVVIGCRWGYRSLQWWPGSPVFEKAVASGLKIGDFQNLILVNMLGRRFYDETGGAYGHNSTGSVNPYTHGDYRNARDITYKPQNFFNAAMAGIGDGHNGGGPIWAIFDADAVAREKWNPVPPNVDVGNGFFFSANTLPELANAIRMEYQRVPMPPGNLAETVARYNTFVDTGVDSDFDKPTPRYKIATPPFYAAWATPMVHDTRAGLRIDANCRVIDHHGHVIPGLYCSGESAGGFSQHGIGRAVCQGLIAGKSATTDPKP